MWWRGKCTARQIELLASNKRGQVFQLNIRADLTEILAGLWSVQENTFGKHFVVNSLELGETLNKHSWSCLRKRLHFALE